jgi:hypothetical protein
MEPTTGLMLALLAVIVWLGITIVPLVLLAPSHSREEDGASTNRRGRRDRRKRAFSGARPVFSHSSARTRSLRHPRIQH